MPVDLPEVVPRLAHAEQAPGVGAALPALGKAQSSTALWLAFAAFDDAGRRAPAAGFVYPGDEKQPEGQAGERAIRLETFKRRLAFLTRGTNSLKLFRLVQELAYLCGVGPAKTQNALAQMLGITAAAAVSKKANSLRTDPGLMVWIHGRHEVHNHGPAVVTRRVPREAATDNSVCAPLVQLAAQVAQVLNRWFEPF
jgi:hypothetical protein